MAEHGGTLTASSTSGRGSVFSFTLPLAGTADGPPQPPAAIGTEPAVSTPIHLPGNAATGSPDHAAPSGDVETAATTADRLAVLAVDDDPVNLVVIEDVLDPAKYDVATATSGAAALSLLDTRQWHVLITDAMMPGMSGYELTRRIRERFSVAELRC